MLSPPTTTEEAAEHWAHMSYRGPEHPVARIFAETKLKLFEKIGGEKVANLVLDFFKNDAGAKTWFVKP